MKVYDILEEGVQRELKLDKRSGHRWRPCRTPASRCAQEWHVVIAYTCNAVIALPKTILSTLVRAWGTSSDTYAIHSNGYE